MVPTRPLTGTVVLPDDGAVSVATRLKWLLIFRIVVISVLLGSATALRATTSEELFARESLNIYALAAAAYGTVVVGAILLRLWPQTATVVAYTQLIADALLAAGLVWITGGHDSPFGFIFSLSILNGAIVLGRRGAFVLAAISSTLFIAVIVRSMGAPPITQALTNTASFFLVAALAGYLTSQLTTASLQLEDARATIEQLEGLYEAVLGSLPSGVVSIGASGAINFVNAAGTDILGNNEVVGRQMHELVPALDTLISAPGNRRFEVELELGARGSRVIGGNVAPLVGRDDARVVVFQDLTELRRLQDDMARTERLAELGRLAAALAHEVRNPLAAMIGCLQLLQADAAAASTTDESARLLGIVHREAERLSGLVQAFLTYARPAEPRRVRCSVRTLIDDTTAAVAHGLSSSTVTVTDVVDADVNVDPDQLRQVLWNVITNADRMGARVDGSPAGAGASTDKKLVVHVSSERIDDDVIIAVDDDGPGVADDLRQRIFEPFFTTRPDGNGLGLATSHQLVSNNGGVMGVMRSKTLGGARFTLRFPAH